jgi:hypothetical protein
MFPDCNQFPHFCAGCDIFVSQSDARIGYTIQAHVGVSSQPGPGVRGLFLWANPFCHFRVHGRAKVLHTDCTNEVVIARLDRAIQQPPDSRPGQSSWQPRRVGRNKRTAHCAIPRLSGAIKRLRPTVFRRGKFSATAMAQGLLDCPVKPYGIHTSFQPRPHVEKKPSLFSGYLVPENKALRNPGVI